MTRWTVRFRGMMAAFGVGAVVWEREVPRSTFTGLAVERMVAMAKGYQVELSMSEVFRCLPSLFRATTRPIWFPTSSGGCELPKQSWHPAWQTRDAWSWPTGASRAT